MQVFANCKRRFHSFIEFYVIQLRNQEVEISLVALNETNTHKQPCSLNWPIFFDGKSNSILRKGYLMSI